MTDVNIIQFKGENQQVNFTITDDDNNSVDLTEPNVNNVYLDVATGLHRYGEYVFEVNGINFGSNGDVEFEIKVSDTESLRPGNYLYEVWIEYENQENYTAEVGKFFVKPRVDR